ncbi:MmgE/PrpD family protein [Tsukamurella soli]|uniref:MmgE/PrpD family protein n=1 Tax=Tsukamurella soli TaxID=644556 RepID=A0ABP8JFG2_9ACTN
MSPTISGSPTHMLAEYAVTTSIDRIPADVKERARLLIIDEMASACLGTRSLGGGLAARYATSIGGTPESRLLGTDVRVPAALAALANGTAGHGEEVDGAHSVGGHPGATIVNAAVAVAERQRATGADLLNAVVLGYDVGIRVVRACGGVFGMRDRLHLFSDMNYALGAAAASARLLGLDATRHRYALALTTFQANGLFAFFQEKRHISKSFANGQYGSAGVTAALMAAMGFEGCDDVIGGPNGVLEAWGVPDGGDLVTAALGTDYAVTTANFKFINAGYPIHAAAEAATTLLRTHGLAAQDVEELNIGMPRNALRVVDNRHMHNICVQDMVCAAVVEDGISIRAVPFPAILGDPEFTRLRAAVTTGVDPELDAEQPDGRGARVSITTRSGLRVSEKVQAPKGHCTRGPIDWDDLDAKWRDGLPDHDIDTILRLGRDLDDIDDVSVLTAAFRPR